MIMLLLLKFIDTSSPAKLTFVGMQPSGRIAYNETNFHEHFLVCRNRWPWLAIAE